MENIEIILRPPKLPHPIARPRTAVDIDDAAAVENWSWVLYPPDTSAARYGGL